MFKDFWKMKLWFLPTRDEQMEMRSDYIKSCLEEIPTIQKEIDKLNVEHEKIIKFLEQSFTDEQYISWVRLRKVSSDLLFQHGRMKHHNEQRVRNIFREVYGDILEPS